MPAVIPEPLRVFIPSAQSHSPLCSFAAGINPSAGDYRYYVLNPFGTKENHRYAGYQCQPRHHVEPSVDSERGCRHGHEHELRQSEKDKHHAERIDDVRGEESRQTDENHTEHQPCHSEYGQIPRFGLFFSPWAPRLGIRASIIAPAEGRMKSAPIATTIQ